MILNFIKAENPYFSGGSSAHRTRFIPKLCKAKKTSAIVSCRANRDRQGFGVAG
jgi:hypothetical protein